MEITRKIQTGELKELRIVMRSWAVSGEIAQKEEENASPSLMRSVTPKKLLFRSLKDHRVEPSFLFYDRSSNLEQEC